jgi:enoyl-CoA hydratase/carnithine racemase
MTQPVRIHDQEGIRTLVLDRGDGRNAVGPDMTAALTAALDDAAGDDSVRVVVLTGEGRMFSAGGNLAQLRDGAGQSRPEEEREALAVAFGLTRRIVEFPRPTIALINGPAAGGGLALALACDLRLASTRAKLVYAYGAIGLAGDFGLNWLLGRLIGPARSRSFAFGGPASAEQALALGLVDSVHPPEALVEAGLARARELAAMSPPALTAIKRNLDCAHLSLAEAGAVEADSFVALRASPEHRAALEAMMVQLGLTRPA